MGAAAQQTDRNFPGNLVQIGPGGHTPLGQSLLVPAHAQQVWSPRLGQPGSPLGNDVPDRGYPRQGQAVSEEGVEEQMHVGVVEAGEYLPPV